MSIQMFISNFLSGSGNSKEKILGGEKMNSKRYSSTISAFIQGAASILTVLMLVLTALALDAPAGAGGRNNLLCE